MHLQVLVMIFIWNVIVNVTWICLPNTHMNSITLLPFLTLTDWPITPCKWEPQELPYQLPTLSYLSLSEPLKIWDKRVMQAFLKLVSTFVLCGTFCQWLVGGFSVKIALPPAHFIIGISGKELACVSYNTYLHTVLFVCLFVFLSTKGIENW